MTDSDLLELDIWIAEKFMGWSRIDGPTYGPSWVDKDKRIITREVTSFPSPFMPSSDPAAFALVKREVERRGWEWEADYNAELRNFGFTLKLGERILSFRRGIASEELAGCLAVKAAVERSNANPD